MTSFILSQSSLSPLTTIEKNALLTERDIVVFSHLRWDFVTQRPQHIMERLGKNQRVFFVEEPIASTAEDYGTVKKTVINSNLIVVQPRMAFEDYEKLLIPQLKKMVGAKKKAPILWFYSAAFVKLSDSLRSSLIVYDCMDELTAFKGASPLLIEQEKQLLQIADLVFTGGKSLYEAKTKRHPSVHCFPSSVDKKHFEKALFNSTKKPKELSHLKNPIAGFYGVIDERMDLNLMRETAELLPQINFVYIGPVVKIDAADLPQAPNIHYLGQRSYGELPAYLKAFDVAFMPFALNEATEFISPTKTLEFMAAHKPIISTAIYDVKRDYFREVSIVNSSQAAARAIKTYLTEDEADRQSREALQAAVIKRTSWDVTVEKMSLLMEGALQDKEGEAVSIPNVFDTKTTSLVGPLAFTSDN